MKFIVASTSTNRKKIFDTLGIQYQTIAPKYEEVINPKKSTKKQVMTFAEGKALSIKEKFKDEENICIIGFDSMVEIDQKTLGKPKNKQDARKMIQSYIGKNQFVFSGVCLTGKHNGIPFHTVFVEKSTITFKQNISNNQIESYLAFNQWQGRCGGYSVAGVAQFFIESIHGDFSNIIGVPIKRITKELEKITQKNMIELVQPA